MGNRSSFDILLQYYALFCFLWNVCCFYQHYISGSFIKWPLNLSVSLWPANAAVLLTFINAVGTTTGGEEKTCWSLRPVGSVLKANKLRQGTHGWCGVHVVQARHELKKWQTPSPLKHRHASTRRWFSQKKYFSLLLWPLFSSNNRVFLRVLKWLHSIGLLGTRNGCRLIFTLMNCLAKFNKALT